MLVICCILLIVEHLIPRGAFLPVLKRAVSRVLPPNKVSYIYYIDVYLYIFYLRFNSY